MKAVLYARVSSEKQDVDLSITAQLKALREYAQRQSYQVVKEFVDEAESGRTSERPQFREMISLARRTPKPFDAVLVWKYSRFARNRQDSIVFKSILRKQGVGVISINEPTEDSSTGRLLEGIIETLDEYYSDNLGYEVTRGMRECASRGFCVSPNVPFGYRKKKVLDGAKERNKLTPEAGEAAIVSRLYQEVLQGKGLMDIVRGLNREGVPAPRGKDWLKTSVFKLLTNEAYTGTLIWSKTSQKGLEPIRVEGAWEPIVGRETFRAVQAILGARAPKKVNPRRIASPYLLSGLARCGHCGRSFVGQDAKSGQFSYYVCCSLVKKGKGTCAAKRLPKERFEQAVIREIKECILTPENMLELIKLVNEDLDSEASESQVLLVSVENELKEVTRRLDRLYDSLETGKLSMDDLAPRIKELRIRQAEFELKKTELEAKLSDRHIPLMDKKTLAGYLSDLQALISGSEFSLKKAFLRSFVREVTVTGQEVRVLYTLPELDMKKTEPMTVLSSVHNGGRLKIRTSDPSLIRTVL